MKEPTCLRCGKCCFLVNPKTYEPLGIKCRFLIKVSATRYTCRIYNQKDRLYRDIGHDNKCCLRHQSPRNYKGCPYNILKPSNPLLGEKNDKNNKKEV